MLRSHAYGWVVAAGRYSSLSAHAGDADWQSRPAVAIARRRILGPVWLTAVLARPGPRCADGGRARSNGLRSDRGLPFRGTARWLRQALSRSGPVCAGRPPLPEGDGASPALDAASRSRMMLWMRPPDLQADGALSGRSFGASSGAEATNWVDSKPGTGDEHVGPVADQTRIAARPAER